MAQKLGFIAAAATFAPGARGCSPGSGLGGTIALATGFSGFEQHLSASLKIETFLSSASCLKVVLMNRKKLEVLFAPAEFAALKERDLRETVCVVFDVLRATSTMVTALANGAAAVIPAEEIAEALALRRERPDLLLAGERDGVRIEANLTGSVAFDRGNSPREFTRERVQGRLIATTTTNGTRALRACASARRVLVGTFLNLQVTAEFIEQEQPDQLLLVCSGTHEEAAYEDVLAAGALCDLLWPAYGSGAVSDSAQMARSLYRMEQGDLPAAFGRSRNGRRLLGLPDLRADVAYCAQRDVLGIIAQLGKDGAVRVMPIN
jgi:2-phosphosulfolactate phosphatase